MAKSAGMIPGEAMWQYKPSGNLSGLAVSDVMRWNVDERRKKCTHGSRIFWPLCPVPLLFAPPHSICIMHHGVVLYRSFFSPLQEWQKAAWPPAGTVHAQLTPMHPAFRGARRRDFPTEHGLDRWDKRVLFHIVGGLGVFVAHSTWCMWTDFKGAGCAHKQWIAQNSNPWASIPKRG